ncbi:MAG TPA: arabinose transporter, partial [Blastocatellia bacterium]|nr:arabinose transporter [Blastocatellia bacterium]
MTDYDLPPALKATPATAQESILVSLLPIIGVVFVAYLVIGLAMPVLPLHVHDGLGRSTFIVGVVAGSQFVVAVFTRSWTGYYADSRGSKRAVIVGLPVAVLSGLCYLLSLLFLSRPVLSVMILLLGRILLGIGENFIIVLLFSQHGWRQAWLAITLLSVAFIAGRIFFGHLPDRGGVKVAFVCIVIEAIGQALIWLAPQPMLAFVGVILTGLGYSL